MRPIDADALEKYIADTFGYPAADILHEIATFPTVDAAPVVHGHWCWQGKFRACSKCGSYVEFTETLGASFWKFCPYCGAHMDLKE